MVKGKWSYKSKEKKSATKNVKTLSISQEKVIELSNYYFKIISEAKSKTKYGAGLKILATKHSNGSCTSKSR